MYVWIRCAALFVVFFAISLSAQTTYDSAIYANGGISLGMGSAREAMWLAGYTDCNHALFNNENAPCGDTSPTGNNDSYVSYLKGLVFQPRVSGLPSYFTSNGNLVVQGNVSVQSGNLGTTAGSTVNLLSLHNSNTNSNFLNITQIRNGNGSDWYTATARIQQVTDVTSQGYIDFNPVSGSYGLAFGSGNSEFFRANNGNFGIGTTSPGARLEVNGNIQLTTNSGASITFADGTVQSTAWSGTLCGGDYAESVDVSGDKTNYEPGDILVVNEGNRGDVAKSPNPIPP